FILQELKALNLSSIYYWAREAPAKAELDFLIELDQGGIIPVEVKSSHNTKARSLKIYLDKYHPQFAVRTSLNQWQVNDQRYDIPLYLFYQITKILAQENT
ncbi:MAG: DUF4143 domain-containing protein, partial [Bacteriovoracaceae bacterium]|nr:DUF4143 domain-containing protein [Bacteriovoracaceae bacterium]